MDNCFKIKNIRNKNGCFQFIYVLCLLAYLNTDIYLISFSMTKGLYGAAIEII